MQQQLQPHQAVEAAPSPPARKCFGPGTSSACSSSANSDQDWTKLDDLADRRRIQNRIAQRKYRSKLKHRARDQSCYRRANSCDCTSSQPSSDDRCGGPNAGSEERQMGADKVAAKPASPSLIIIGQGEPTFPDPLPLHEEEEKEDSSALFPVHVFTVSSDVTGHVVVVHWPPLADPPPAYPAPGSGPMCGPDPHLASQLVAPGAYYHHHQQHDMRLEAFAVVEPPSGTTYFGDAGGVGLVPGQDLMSACINSSHLPGLGVADNGLISQMASVSQLSDLPVEWPVSEVEWPVTPLFLSPCPPVQPPSPNP